MPEVIDYLVVFPLPVKEDGFVVGLRLLLAVDPDEEWHRGVEHVDKREGEEGNVWPSPDEGPEQRDESLRHGREHRGVLVETRHS